MDITWLGHACTRIRTRDAAVLCDPTDRSSGIDMSRPTADIVTISHRHPHHDHLSGVRGDPMVIDGPGEYEVQGVQILGIPTLLRAEEAEEHAPSGRNVAYLFGAEDLQVAHLGGIGIPPNAEQVELLSNIDLLIVPIGEGGTITPQEAARTARSLEPRITIPVCYRSATDDATPDALSTFISAFGLEAEAPVPRLSVNRRNLGDAQRIVVLEARGAS